MRVRTPATRAGPAALAVARALGLTPRESARLLAVERVLPADLGDAQATALVETLTRSGCHATLVPVPPGSGRCAAHPTLSTEAACERCRASVCALCTDARGRPECASCADARRRRRRNQLIRVAVLLVILSGVGGWALGVVRARDARTKWHRPLSVSLVVASATDVPPGMGAAWRAGGEQLDAWFASEATRLGLPLTRPFSFSTTEPVRVASLPTPPPDLESPVDRARSAFAFRQELETVASAAHAPSADVTIIVALAAEDGAGRFVEGIGEEGGRFGLVHGTVDETGIALELTAVAHEVLHTVGARDLYDAEGHAVTPDGLAEPDRAPRYPQTFAEVMCGEVPLGPSSGRLPKSLDEVRVGPATARDIRWVKAASGP